MALPSSGQLSLNQVNIELGFSGTAQIGMGDTAVRGLFERGSGQVSMSNGHGKANVFFLTISSHTKQGNLRTLALNAGWNGSAPVECTINSGIYCWSDATSTAGLTINGSFPNGLIVHNYGRIIGRGGNGSGSNVNGTAGGSGLYISTSGVSIQNKSGAYIAGGGGGGGSSGGYRQTRNGAGGGAGGGKGGGARAADGGYVVSGGAGGAIGSNGSYGGSVAGAGRGAPGGAGSGGGAESNYGSGTNGVRGGSGAGGGRVLPGSGGSRGAGMYGAYGGNGGSAGNVGGNNTRAHSAYGAGGAGGGGWGARGGNAVAITGHYNTSGGAGGKAIQKTVSYSLSNSGTIYGAT